MFEKYKTTLFKKEEDKNLTELPQGDFLSKKDFGQVFDFLFSNDEFLAQTKNVNIQPYKEV